MMKENQLVQKLQRPQAMVLKPRQRLDALLDQQNTKEAVCALSPMEFYDLYHDLGANDALELLNYCSGEQLQTCFDLDLWRGDELEDAALTPWVESLLTIEDDEQFKAIFNEIDPELLPLYLNRNVHLYIAEDKNDEVEIPEGESPNVMQTPDMIYWIAYPEDNTKAEVLRQLVDRIYHILGVEKAWSYIEKMHWEMASNLEETCYHFRTERIREYGFLPREEACAIFANCALAAETEAIRQASGKDVCAHAFDQTERFENAIAHLKSDDVDDTYFAHILSQMDDLESLRVQLLSLAQRVATADGFQPHEEQGVDDSMLLAICDVNIGLEYTSRRDDELARRILAKTPLSKLFNIGHNVTLELHRKAKLLTVRGHLSIIEDQPLSLLTNAQRDCIEGLLEARPRPALSTLKPFKSMQDIGAAAQAIADVALREVFFGIAANKQKDDIATFAYTHELYLGVEEVNFDNVAATWMLNRYLKLEDPWRPIRLSELPSRDEVLTALSPESMRAFYKSSLDETTVASQMRLAHQLTAELIEGWPASQKRPDPRAFNVLVIENEEDI